MKVLERIMAEGDATMADKGFEIVDELSKLKMKLNTPPFLKDNTGVWGR